MPLFCKSSFIYSIELFFAVILYFIYAASFMINCEQL